jgi:hypothetical protein
MSINGPITKYEVEFNKTGGRSENRNMTYLKSINEYVHVQQIHLGTSDY